MRVCKDICGALVLFCAGALHTGWAQSRSAGSVSVSPLSMPSVSAPTMPTVSAPSIGNDYYVPGSKSFYSGPQGYPEYPGVRNGLASRTNQTATAPAQTATAAGTKKDASSTGLLSAATNSKSLFAGLTASDLNDMSSRGLLGQVSGLLGGKSAADVLSGSAVSGGANSSMDSILLQQILGQLTELKNQNEKPAVNGAAVSFTQEGKAGSKILRFSVNGDDVLSTCRDIYFSTQESDGSFLLTGDRKYEADGTSNSETFYLLFRVNGANQGITRYFVTPEVTQNVEDTCSVMYQLAQKTNLTARRTGNLISMRANDADWKLDVLLSMQ